MLETLVIYCIRPLPSIIICFMGIVAFKYGLQRFGVLFKVPLWLVFVVLWLLGTLTGFLFGVQAVQKIPALALPIFLIGILFWIVSLIFGSKRTKVRRSEEHT